MLFWGMTLILLLSASCFILPWIDGWKARVATLTILSMVTYGLYAYLGNSQYLPHYYSDEQKMLRAQQQAFRPLIAEFRKEEFRLRARLEINPKDIDAEWRLWDLLAIKALNNGDVKRAKDYWGKAIQKIPNTPANKPIKTQILEMLNRS